MTSLYQWWCLWVHTSDDLALTMTFELYLDLTWQVLYCHSWYLHLCCHLPNQHCKRRSQHRNSIRRAESSSTTLTQHGILQVNISATWKDKCYWYLFHWIKLRKLHGIHKFCPSDVAARHTGVALAMIIIIILLIKQIDTLMES